MALARRAAEMMHGYTVEEVARFLQYDPQAIRYWLRTGHLTGYLDRAIEDWRVAPSDLVAFLRQSSEPMPTGVVLPSHCPVVRSAAPRTARPAALPPALDREPLMVETGAGIG